MPCPPSPPTLLVPPEQDSFELTLHLHPNPPAPQGCKTGGEVMDMKWKGGDDTYSHGLQRDLLVVVDGLLLVGRVGVPKARNMHQITEVESQGDSQQPRGWFLEGDGEAMGTAPKPEAGL